MSSGRAWRTSGSGASAGSSSVAMSGWSAAPRGRRPSTRRAPPTAGAPARGARRARNRSGGDAGHGRRRRAPRCARRAAGRGSPRRSRARRAGRRRPRAPRRGATARHRRSRRATRPCRSRPDRHRAHRAPSTGHGRRGAAHRRYGARVKSATPGPPSDRARRVHLAAGCVAVLLTPPVMIATGVGHRFHSAGAHPGVMAENETHEETRTAPPSWRRWPARAASRTPAARAAERPLDQLRAHPVLPEHVVGQEREHRRVPDLRVPRLEHPVVLVGEVQELRDVADAAVTLQVVPEP